LTKGERNVQRNEMKSTLRKRNIKGRRCTNDEIIESYIKGERYDKREGSKFLKAHK
jgi:hypothetical protein